MAHDIGSLMEYTLQIHSALYCCGFLKHHFSPEQCIEHSPECVVKLQCARCHSVTLAIPEAAAVLTTSTLPAAELASPSPTAVLHSLPPYHQNSVLCAVRRAFITYGAEYRNRIYTWGFIPWEIIGNSELNGLANGMVNCKYFQLQVFLTLPLLLTECLLSSLGS